MTSYLVPASDVDVNASVFDNIYQGSTNMTRSSFRVFNSVAASEGLQNLNIGSETAMKLVQNMLIKVVTVTFVLSGIDLAFVRGHILPQGWGYEALQYHEFQCGGSDKLIIEGRSNLLKHLADCETNEKREAILNLGGKEYEIGATGDIPNQIATIVLYLPWSNVNSSRVLPYDTSILDGPVTINIRTKPSRDWVLKPKNIVGSFVYPRQWQRAYIQTQTMLMVDGPAVSIKEEVGLPTSTNFYTYGYIFPQYYSIQSRPIAQALLGNNVNNRTVIRLDQFRNGSIASLDMRTRLYGYVDNANETHTIQDVVYNPNYYLPVYNVLLKYANQTLYETLDNTNEIYDLTEYPLPSSFNVPVYPWNEAAIPTVASASSSWVHIPLAQFNETFFSNYIQSGPSLVNNQVSLEFNYPAVEDIPQLKDISAQVKEVIFQVELNYNMQAGVRTGGGRTGLIFLPPQSVLSPAR